MADAKQDIPELTGVRFIAASMVFLYHYAEVLFPQGDRQFGYYFFRQFNTGVNLFFVLSGFLITYRYYDFLTTRQSVKLYFLKRITRIFPLYWVVLFVHFAFQSIKAGTLPDFKTLLLNVTLLHGFSARYFYSGLTQSWSLTVEETFYLLAPVLFLLVHYFRFFLMRVPLLLVAGFLLLGFTSLYTMINFFGNSFYLLYGTLLGRGFEFVTGIFLALQIIRYPHKREGIVFTLCGIVLFFGLLLALAAISFQSSQSGYNDSFPGILLFHVLMPFSIGYFYYGLLVEDTKIKKILAGKPMTLLGKSSYAFYLLHVGVLAEIIYFHVSSNLVILFIFLQCASIAAYKLFEKPVYFFLLKKFNPLKEIVNRKALKRDVCSASEEKGSVLGL